jgi:hypothetical protein
MSDAQKKLENRVRGARIRELERRLADERTGLQALAQAFLAESDEPERLMTRLDQMAENAVMQGKPQRVRDVLVYGQQIFRTAMERHLLKQTTLFKVDEAEVQSLAKPTEGQGSLLPPGELHEEMASSDRELKERIIAIFQVMGGLTDPKLEATYRQRYGPAAPGAIQRARKDLTRAGRISNLGAGGGKADDYRWDLTERTPVA